MADLQPLRTLRYEPSAVGSLEDVIAPPYDVIDAELRAQLAARSPYNVVEIDLPPSYAQAAATMADWQQRGVLVREDEPAVWVLRQDYEAPDGAAPHAHRRPRAPARGRVRAGPDPPARAHASRAEGGPPQPHPRHAHEPVPHLQPLR